MINDAVGYGQLYYRYRKGYEIFLIDVNVNLCDYLNKKASQKLIDIVLPHMQKHLVFNTGRNLSCPFIGQFEIVKFPLSGSIFKMLFLPVGDYMVNLTVSFGSIESLDKFIWNGKVFFNVPAGKTIEDDRMGR